VRFIDGSREVAGERKPVIRDGDDDDDDDDDINNSDNDKLLHGAESFLRV